MISLFTERDGQRNRYVRIDKDNKGQVVFRRECSLQVIRVDIDRQVSFTLLDGDGHSNLLFHRYINERLVDDHRSVNSRRKAAEVLCKFYSFLDLMCLSEYALGIDELYQLRTFLLGAGKAQCSNETVNAYLSVIRNFFAVMGIPCDALFSQHIIRNALTENDFRANSDYYAYDLNFAKNTHKQERVPKYISMDQYILLQEIAQKNGDWNGVMLMHLMFRYGMRIGECLGLTEEDFVTYRIKSIDVPTLIIRNRISDEPWQHAKRKLVPGSPLDYESRTYIKQWRDDDYAHYYLTESGDFVEAFRKFILHARTTSELNNPKNYRSCEADIVYPVDFSKKGLDKNHYIFINRLGKRLSAQNWGLTLKKYFMEAGIPVDLGKKDNNLSHRFRHGFAMMHARFMNPPVPIHELQKMMHHCNVSSTMIYYNPTLEDEYEYKTALQNQFYDTNPRLNSIIASFLNEGVNENR